MKCLAKMICHYSTCVVPGTVEVAPVVFNLPKPVKKGSVISSFLLIKGLQYPLSFPKMLNPQMNLIIAMPSSTMPNGRHSSRLFDTWLLSILWQDGVRSPGVIHSTWEELSISVWNCRAVCPKSDPEMEY